MKFFAVNNISAPRGGCKYTAPGADELDVVAGTVIAKGSEVDLSGQANHTKRWLKRGDIMRPSEWEKHVAAQQIIEPPAEDEEPELDALSVTGERDEDEPAEPDHAEPGDGEPEKE